MSTRQVSPSLLHLLVTLIYAQIACSTPLPSGNPSLNTTYELRDSSPAAIVTNNCPWPVYLWSVADTSSPCQTLAPNGGVFTEIYQQRTSGGISLKISKQNSLVGNISQFEYTIVPSGPWQGIFWDLSHVNGQPFEDEGEEVIPKMRSGGQSYSTCQVVSCPQDEICMGAYNKPDDDFATHECPLDTDLMYTLCSAGNNATPDISSGTPAQPQPSTVPMVPATVQTQAPAAMPTPSISTVQAQSLVTTTTCSGLNGAPGETTIITEVVTTVVVNKAQILRTREARLESTWTPGSDELEEPEI